MREYTDGELLTVTILAFFLFLMSCWSIWCITDIFVTKPVTAPPSAEHQLINDKLNWCKWVENEQRLECFALMLGTSKLSPDKLEAICRDNKNCVELFYK